MPRIVVSPGLDGLGALLAELVRRNIEAHPEREDLLKGVEGTVNVAATDADTKVGIEFAAEELRFGEPFANPDLSIATSGETLLSLSNAPLRFGLPDLLTAEGRRISAMLLSGAIEVKGLPRNVRLMVRLQRLFSVS